MRWRLDGILELNLPDDWQAVATRRGTAFVRTQALNSAGSVEAVRELSVFISHLAVDELPPSQRIEDLMGRRVRQGYPARFHDNIAGKVAQGFQWTDGIFDELSLFICIADGSIVEILASRAGGDTYPSSLRDAATRFFQTIQWLPHASAAKQWVVWRQDDNGNRTIVSSGHTRDEAEAICARFEAHGHKQLYWAASEDESPSL